MSEKIQYVVSVKFGQRATDQCQLPILSQLNMILHAVSFSQAGFSQGSVNWLFLGVLLMFSTSFDHSGREPTCYGIFGQQGREKS